MVELLKTLKRIAPLRYAEKWDNVGLLVDPPSPRPLKRVLLTIDLTEAVFAEALAIEADFIVAYHPPIFGGLKRLRMRDPQERTVLRAIKEGIPIYSPHTALDAAPGGLNDWLLEAFGPLKSVHPLSVRRESVSGQTHKLVVFVPADRVDAVRDALADLGAGGIGAYRRCAFTMAGEGTFQGDDSTHPTVGHAGRFERTPEVRLEMVCGALVLAGVSAVLKAYHPYEEPAWEAYALADRVVPGVGAGRRAVLEVPQTLGAFLPGLKAHLGLSQVRVAGLLDQPVRSVAVCPGAGGSLLEKVRGIDLLLTGEMRHHDVLAHQRRGTAVILTDHTHTERGYLPRLATRLRAAHPALKIQCSKLDDDPLRIH